MGTQPILPLHRTPSAGYEAPFDMLAACHERVDRMLRLLRRLRAHVRTMGCDEQAQQAARDVVRYFDMAAPAHHEDEERHVFPSLRAAGQLADTVDRLQHEHQQMALLWPRVRSALQRVADGLALPVTPEEDSVMDEYAALYEWHLAAENELVFPAAAAQLDSTAQVAMGEEMATRRGVVLPR